MTYKINTITSARTHSWSLPLHLTFWSASQIRAWFVLSLATAGWLLMLLFLVALVDESFSRHFLDPLVYWASRLVWQ
jgi:hypothetical protein